MITRQEFQEFLERHHGSDFQRINKRVLSRSAYASAKLAITSWDKEAEDIEAGRKAV
ncbi:MAG: hypothetical protein Q8Q24_00960 [bacterium]|nr:hypothetical protein [bacterium]